MMKPIIDLQQLRKDILDAKECIEKEPERAVELLENIGEELELLQLPKINRMQKRLRAARRLLKPFAHPDLCRRYSNNPLGGTDIIFQRNEAILRIKDSRLAAKWLREEDGN